MAVHPTIAEFLGTLPPSDGSVPDPVAHRAQDASLVPPLVDREPVARVEDTVAPSAAGDVPVRVYTPAAERRGAIVYAHGGAFFSGSLDTHDGLARRLANATGWTVVSVGFRLAPEHAFPAGLNDVTAAVRWAAGQPAWADARLAVVGDSSGGTFAAAVAAAAHDEGFATITDQVLLYPSLDLRFDTDLYPSLRENAAGFGLETASLQPWNSHYVDGGADPTDPRVSPILREDLAGLPATLIVTAEFDPLRDEGEEYGRRLDAAGVPTTVRRYDGATHGFVQHFSWVPEFAGAFDEIAAFLNRTAAQD